ncbi:MAG: hypothetical protein M1826_004646 [Phylliscum demangeonii]|nr:MAG: hypothetical protein M1826_004646 [Phylliscum demangeonii]
MTPAGPVEPIASRARAHPAANPVPYPNPHHPHPHPHQHHHHRHQHHPPSDPSRLAPEAAVPPRAHSPPRRPTLRRSAESVPVALHGAAAATASGRRGRSGHRRKAAWKKLLWVKQSYPDNYTDEETFLDALQRNPRLRPYGFWALVADSSVIVQHLCAVAIFVCCFVGIFQARISPVAVVGWGNAATLLGWFCGDRWLGQQEAAAAAAAAAADSDARPGGGGDGDGDGDGEGGGAGAGDDGDDAAGQTNGSLHHGGAHPSAANGTPRGLGVSLPATTSEPDRWKATTAFVPAGRSVPSPASSAPPTGAARFAPHGYHPLYGASASILSRRNQQRLATAKSAGLIYCALLGLSPILKSLTRSWTSDSIWAMSCWLMAINVFFFDYGGAEADRLPASLSTNAALMASTVLASRLPSTPHVFSLTLFSIEVFGLFPIFRRDLRRISWRGHLALTFALMTGAGGGVGVAIAGGGWQAAIVGVLLGWCLTGLGMGGCSWWLIGLQRYKNEIRGPWDPARPVIRRHWD